MFSISTNILTVLANFLGIIIQPFLKIIGCDCGNTRLCRSFSNLWKLFPKVPLGTRNFPKASESSLRWSEPSLGFLCDPQIVIAVLYKYEALPLQNIITFTSLNSLDPRSDLRLSA